MMPGPTKEQILIIIRKHIGEQVFVVTKKSMGVLINTGFLKKADDKELVLSNEKGNGDTTEIPFDVDHGSFILHVYNRNNIDLLKAASTPPLSEKLKDRDKKKRIFARIKPHLNKDLYFIYKQKSSLNSTTGMFVDMGIMGISLKLSPFYNKELSLPYNSVLHIYSEDHEDLLD